MKSTLVCVGIAFILCTTVEASSLSARARSLVSSRLGAQTGAGDWQTKKHRCKNDFQCPAYSKRKEGQSCYDSFDDCYCILGYEKVGHACQPICEHEIKCPVYSKPKHGVTCVDHISKCECKSGYEPVYPPALPVAPEDSTTGTKIYSAVLEPIGDSGVLGEVTVIALGGDPYGMVMYSGAATGLESNLLSLAQNGSDCSSKNGCGVHIHDGDACTNSATQGGHLFNGDGVDPWTDAIYDITDSQGASIFVGEIPIGAGIGVNDKPFIVHNNKGLRVACGLLRPLQDDNERHHRDGSFTCQPICYNDYHCPTNSFRKHGRKCYDSFDDCECEHGFEKKYGKCQPICFNDYHCPANSFRKHGRKCYDSFDDCECEHGFEQKHGKCQPICYNDYHCPANSFRKHGRKCYDSFDDCECEHGFEKKHGKCQPICYNDYHCPENSFRKHNRKCYNDFNDCECEYGFEKKHGQCVEKYNCHTREAWFADKQQWCCDFKGIGCRNLRH